MAICVYYLLFFVVEAVSRYYESRRRLFNDSQPERQTAKQHNEKKTRIRNRQRQVIIFVHVVLGFFKLHMFVQVVGVSMSLSSFYL